MDKGIILCGHGTKSQQGISSFFKVYAELETKLNTKYAINYGFIENSSPSLNDAILEHIKNGRTEIVILPALLFSGVHISHDIPFTVQTLLKEHPNVKIKLAPNLGLSKKIIELCLQLIEQQLNNIDGVANNKRLLVVGVGSSKPKTNINIAKLSRILWENMPFKYATYSFISKMTFPSVDDELERLKVIGKNDIIVLPIILFPGVYLDNIVLKLENFKRSFKGKVQVCNSFDNNALLIESFIDRLKETIYGETDLLNDVNIIEKARK
ncbi:MAG: sirohydrochlorin chelatase [Salinivirgaceae bacterium]|jgi:sirohydrochlorin cobaltochelatase|nr:sirohydrochlorin chelatase [Salinivirgaceae bacterium]